MTFVIETTINADHWIENGLETVIWFLALYDRSRCSPKLSEMIVNFVIFYWGYANFWYKTCTNNVRIRSHFDEKKKNPWNAIDRAKITKSQLEQFSKTDLHFVSALDWLKYHSIWPFFGSPLVKVTPKILTKISNLNETGFYFVEIPQCRNENKHKCQSWRQNAVHKWQFFFFLKWCCSEPQCSFWEFDEDFTEHFRWKFECLSKMTRAKCGLLTNYVEWKAHEYLNIWSTE